MKLDYIENINEFGEHVVRLYDFDKEQAIWFKELVEAVVVKRKQKLDLSKADFIEPRNCNVIMGPFHTDEGMFTVDNETFFCALTLDGFKEMLKRLEPFCKKETQGYGYLYELDNPIDFLFSPAGTW